MPVFVVLLLLVVIAVAEVMCLIFLYHRAFYQKVYEADNFFVGVSFVGFVCALLFLSLLHIYMDVKANPKFGFTFLFIAFPPMVSGLYALPFSVVMNNNRKKKERGEIWYDTP